MLTLFAVAFVLSEPTGAAAWRPVEAAYGRWQDCVVRGARQRAHEAISADVAGEEAAARCEAEAGQWREAYGAWLAAEHRDAALAEPMATVARCHMARRGAAAAAAYRPPAIAATRGAAARLCPEPPAVQAH